ncbi:MAG: DUF4426 domain-containing protein [Halioglobus sp.]|nr:DUF4426 domain-containing protein [Caldilineaceae bacterium]MCB1689808.1 DUF4426 domain-containing protein [Halioglobus sp.]
MDCYRYPQSQRCTDAPLNKDLEIAPMRPRFCGVVVSLVFVTGLLATSASASEYQTIEQDGVTVRCNTVNSQFVPEASLHRYQLQADKNRGLLSCVVQRQNEAGQLVNIPAKVSAQVENFYGVTSAVEMRELSVDEQNFEISYIGSYDVLSQHELTFTIQITPQGSDSPIVLTMTDEEPAK